MLSSFRILRSSAGLSNSSYYFNKGIQKCCLHIRANTNVLPGRRRFLFSKVETYLNLGAISSIRHVSSETPIPDTPVPPPPEIQDADHYKDEVSSHAVEVTEELLPSLGKKEDSPEIHSHEEVLPESPSFEEVLLNPPEILPQTLNTSEVLSEDTNSNQVASDDSERSEVLPESPPFEEVLPDPPEILPQTPLVDIVEGEASLESLGLGGWGPVGLVQKGLDFLHITCDLPWWGSIIVGTIVVRTLMFPLVIVSQRNAAKMHNNLPELQTIQVKMADARERGDRLEAARCAQDMMTFMKEKGMNPLKNMLVPFAQAPLFISFFLGLRGMAYHPVESMKVGGLFWFTDLTVPDEFYLLPIITSATLAVTIEVGTDTARLNSSPNLGLMKYVLRAMPVVIFPFTVGFPSAILVYWVSSNFISLIQVSTLKIPAIRQFFNIDKLKVYDKTQLPIKDKGFVKGVSDSWTNLKITRELEERQRVDEINFRRAGRGAVKKTFKFDPTQTHSASGVPTLQAKKRD